MKTRKKTISLIILVISLFFFNSCENLTSCKEIEKSEIVMLFDVSDDKLFKEIQSDMKSNFPDFMKHTNFADIRECQQVKLSLGTLSGKDELKIKSHTISISEKGLSGAEKRKRGNPSAIVPLVQKSLIEYNDMSKNKIYNSSTNILGTTAKAIIGMDADSENTLLILSDMVVYNKTESVNFYKTIPKDAKSTVRKLIDPILMNKLNGKIEEGLELKIIIVLKNEQENKVKKKDVKVFWLKAFKSLNFDDIQFIDNLTNDILWD